MAEILINRPHLLDSIQVAFLVTDGHSNILYANRPTEHLLGYAKDEIIGQRVRVLFLDEDLVYFLPNIIYLALYKNGFNGEVLLRRKDGSKIFVHLIATAFKEEGEIFLTFSFQVIQRIKHLEKEKLEAERWASLGRMVGEIAHQIRHPAVSIGGYANRLLKGFQFSPKGKFYLVQILQETKRLETIIHRVEEYIRMPRLTFKKERVMEVVERSLQSLSGEAAEKGISLALEAGSLKGNGDSFIDQELVMNALSHIVRNGLDAVTLAAPKRQKKKVKVSLFEEGEYLGISVSDHGEGISKKNLGFVFDPFFSTRPDRVGLGLTFVRRVMEEHQGRIQIESRLKRGTTVTLYFPRDRRRKIQARIDLTGGRTERRLTVMVLKIPKLPAKYLIPQFILAHFSHHVSIGVLVPLLPLLREGFGLNYFQAGVLVSSFSLSYGFGQVPMAILGDRLSRRPLIVFGMIGTSLAGIGVSLTQAFWQMVLCFIAMGLFGATYHAPTTSFLSQVLPPGKRGKAFGMHFIGGPASFFLTPVMALAIVSWFHSWRVSFFILALPALLAGAMLWFTMEESLTRVEGGTKTSKGMGGDSSSIGSNEARMSWGQILRALGFFACLAMSLQVVVAGVNSYLPLYMVDRHHISPKWAGFVISIIAGVGIVGAPFGGGLSDRLGRKSIIFLSVSLTGPLLLAITKSPYGILLLLSLMLYGLAMSVRMPTMESLITDVVPIRQRTTVLGIYLFLGVETSGVTTPVVGHLIDTYGSEAVFTALGLGMCLVAAMAWLIRKKI